ncbi:MAG TPA: class I SAM-dependent methyltransferase, partial [Nitrososphaera sp.]|nr:class I SAM-dependent methyltransferase [Nitrososphaera sp.]
MTATDGLGSRYWGEVIEVLRSIIPVYDKVNRVISLGKDEEYRLRGIRGRVMQGNAVLDAGSGYGNMSRVALAAADGDARIVMYDPIPEMLASVVDFFGGNKSNVGLSSGVFEHMPFRESVFDVVMCGYSLRDAIRLRQAISEMHRVLKDGGRLVIVDLGKPDGAVQRALVSAYLKYFLGIFAYLVAGKAGLRFRTLYGTFLRWPRNSELEAMLKEHFSRVEFEKGMMGGAVIIA